MRWQAVIIAAMFWGRGGSGGSVRGPGPVQEDLKHNGDHLKHVDSMC